MKTPLALRIPTLTLLITLGICVAGCQRYSVDLNQNVLYQPASLIRVSNVPDPRLAGCLEQAVLDARVTDSRELTQLVCSSAGVTHLEGVDQFSRLQQLNLRNNQLTDVSPLFLLTHLEYLDLAENPQIACEAINRLRALNLPVFIAPDSCV